MATFWMHPRHAGDLTQLTPNPGSAQNYENARTSVDPDVFDDPRDSWNEATAAALADLYLIDTVPPVDPLAITQLVVFADLNSLVGSFIDVVIKFEGTVYVVSNEHGIGGGLWAGVGAAIARPGGGSWTLEDFAELQIGTRSTTVAGGDTIKTCAVRARCTYDPRPSSTPEAGTSVAAVAAPSPDPKRFTLDVEMTTDDHDSIDDAGDATAIRTLGPFLLPGQTYPVFLTLGQQSVINHP